MNEMPVVRVSVMARILTHRRDEHPIGKRQISNRERIKQARHGHKLKEGGAPATPGEHAAAMEDVAGVLSKNERLTLLRLLKKLGKHAAETRK